MMPRVTIPMLFLTGLCAVLWLVAPPQAVHADDTRDERAELRERFKQRHPILLALKDQGKVGETWRGYVDTVADEYREQHIRPDDKDDPGPTIVQFIAQENTDRRRLYALLAERYETTPEAVAARNARRQFDQAAPEHHLLPRDRPWIKKKDLDAEKAED